MTSDEMSRRAFLARTGVLGASALLLPRCAAPESGGELDGELVGLGVVIGLLRPVLAELSRDTLNGLVAFSLPGSDPYSTAQGTPRGEPGGIQAGGTTFLVQNLDRFLGFPDEIARPAASALVVALRGLPIPLPVLGDLLGLPDALIGPVEQALLSILQNDETVPLSLPIALILNALATLVDPFSLHGPFLSPFARLSFADKARAMEMLETSQPALVALVDAHAPEPLRASASGLLEFLGGALHEFAAFGCVGESAVFDRRRRSLTGRPVGWQLTGYLPDNQTGDGWDDLLGYYQNRREVSDG